MKSRPPVLLKVMDIKTAKNICRIAKTEINNLSYLLMCEITILMHVILVHVGLYIFKSLVFLGIHYIRSMYIYVCVCACVCVFNHITLVHPSFSNNEGEKI